MEDTKRSISIWETEQEARRGAFYESMGIDINAPIFSNGRSLKSLSISSEIKQDLYPIQSSPLSVEKLLYESFNSIKDRPDGIREESLNGFKDLLNKHNFFLNSKETKEAYDLVEQLFKESALENAPFEKKYNAVGSITYFAGNSSYTDTFYTNDAFLKDLNEAFNDQPYSIKYAVLSKDDILQEKINNLLNHHFDLDNTNNNDKAHLEIAIPSSQEIKLESEIINRSVEDWQNHYLEMFKSNKTEYEKEKISVLNSNNSIYFTELLDTAKQYVSNIKSKNHLSILATEPILQTLIQAEPKVDRNLFFNRKRIEEQKKEHDKWETKKNTLSDSVVLLKKTLSEVTKLNTEKDYINWFIEQGNKDGKCYSTLKNCFNTYLDNEKNQSLKRKIKGFINADNIIEKKLADNNLSQSRSKCF